MEIIVVCHVDTGIATKPLNHQDLLPDLPTSLYWEGLFLCEIVKSIESTAFWSKTPSHQDLPPKHTTMIIFAMEFIVVCHAHTAIATKPLNHRDLLPDLTKMTIWGTEVSCVNVKMESTTACSKTPSFQDLLQNLQKSLY